MPPVEALRVAAAGGRRPTEAVEAGRADREELLALVGGRR